MIKLRNLDPSLKQWIMTTTGLGPGIGDVHYVVPVGSATSKYNEWLRRDMNVHESKVHHNVLDGYNALTGYRNDCLLVMPGAYDETAELAWAKQNTHLLGLGGPNVGGDWSEPNVVIYSDSVDCASVITVTGANSQFHNVVVSNYGNNSACLTAFTAAIYGLRFKNVAFQGVMTAGNDDVVAAASLYITGAGMYPLFENCTIGQDVWDMREGANSGVLRFTSAGRPNGGTFRDCKFLSVSNTVTAAAVAVPTGTFIGRSWLFERCSFINSNPDFGTNCNQVFYLEPTGLQKDIILLKDCAAFGYDAWDDASNANILSDMAVPAVTGGLGIEPT